MKKKSGKKKRIRAGNNRKKVRVRKPSAKRVVTKGTSKRRGTRKSKTAKKPRPIKRRIKEIRKAELVLKRPEGTDLVGSTQWITPTKRGFDAVENMVREAVTSAPKKVKATVEIYHYSIYLNFRGPHGKIGKDKLEGIGLPFFSWVKKTRGKKEQVIKNAREAARLNVYKMLSKHFDIISPGKTATAGKMSEAKAKKMLISIRKGRDIRFKFVLYRTTVKR